jgi:hypothetical protein
VGELDAEDFPGSVRVGIEMDEPNRPIRFAAGADVRLRDRVVASEDDRQRARGEHLSDGLLDRRVRAGRVGGHDRPVAEVDDAKVAERVDAGFQVTTGAPAGRPNRARAEPRPRPVRDEVVEGRADDRHVRARELAGILRVRHAPIGEEPGVVRLARPAPACLGVDHRAMLTRFRTALAR